jgi:CelD/BcsL family acetyltransferase involved in cellulose biosynthesis
MTLVTGSEDAAYILQRMTVPSAAAGTLKFEIVSTPSAIEKDWRELETRAVGGPFQRFDFYQSWLATLGRRCRPLVLTARRTGRLVAVLPLVTRRIGPAVVAEFAGGSHATYNLGLFDRLAWKSTAPSLAKGLRAAFADSGAGVDLVRLRFQPGEIDGFPNPFVDARSALSPHATYDLSLEGGFDAVLERHKGTRKRRRMRQQAGGFKAAGGYRVRRAENADDALAILDAFFEQKAARFASQGIPNVFAKPGTAAFLSDLVDRAFRPCGLDHPPLLVYALETDRGIAATGFLHAYDGTAHLAMNSFAQDEFARLGPGDLALFHIIEDLANRGFERFDFGVGDARYKQSWYDREIRLHDTVIPLSPAGSIAAGAVALSRRAADRIRANPKLHRLAQRIRSGRIARSDAGQDE